MSRVLLAAIAAASAAFPHQGDDAGVRGWRIPFCGGDSRPVVVEGVIYIGGQDGALYAIEAATGKTRWHYQTGVGLPSDPTIVVDAEEPMAGIEVMSRFLNEGAPPRRAINATPLVDQGTVYFPSGDRTFYALAAASGALKWKLDLPGEAHGPVLADGRVIFSAGNRVYGVEPSDGRVAWTFEVFAKLPKDLRRRPSIPVVVNGTAYVTAEEHEAGEPHHRVRVVAIDTRTGRVRWSFETVAMSPTGPLVDRGLVWVAANEDWGGDLFLYALDASSGAQRWIFKAENPSSNVGQLLLAAGRVVLATSDKLFGVDALTGQLAWRAEGDWAYRNLHQDGVVIATRGGWGRGSPTVDAIDPSSGKAVWSMGVDDYPRILGTDDGAVYVAGESSLTAIAIDGGQKRWRFKTGDGRQRWPGGRATEAVQPSAGPVITEGRACFASGMANSAFSWGMLLRGSFFCIDARTGRL